MTITEVKLARDYTRLKYIDNPLNSVKHSYVSSPDILLPILAIEALCGCWFWRRGYHTTRRWMPI